MRTRPRADETVSPSHRAKAVLRPFSASIVLPIFTLTSAGVSLDDATGFETNSIAWGVLAGKVAGIFGASWLTTRVTSARLNPRITWADIAGLGLLGGIGFTVSLLIADLSYTDPVHLTDARGAVLLVSTVASVLAAVGWDVAAGSTAIPVCGRPLWTSRRGRLLT